MQIHLGTGRRKTAVARVRLLPGAGTVVVNKKPVEEYFAKIKTLVRRISHPLRATNTEGTYAVHVTVGGGGQAGQAGAIVHGIARALCRANLSFRPVLKSLGFLTRDPRMKERKKYGQRGARARYQFSKR